MWQKYVSLSRQTCFVQHMLVLTKTLKKKQWKRKVTQKRRHGHWYISNLLSVAWPLRWVTWCWLVFLLCVFPLCAFLSVFACKQERYVLRSRPRSVCSVASRSRIFWKQISALSKRVGRLMRYDALSSSLWSPPPLSEEQPPSEWGQAMWNFMLWQFC